MSSSARIASPSACALTALLGAAMAKHVGATARQTLTECGTTVHVLDEYANPAHAVDRALCVAVLQCAAKRAGSADVQVLDAFSGTGLRALRVRGEPMVSCTILSVSCVAWRRLY